MLTVTNAALEHLHEALRQSETANPECFRLAVTRNDKLGLVVQEPESDDETFECKGDTVLAAPEPLQQLLDERVLDLDEDGQLVLVPKTS